MEEGVFRPCEDVVELAGDLEGGDCFRGMEELKCVPGPVSSLGAGAVKGSKRYLEACQ